MKRSHSGFHTTLPVTHDSYFTPHHGSRFTHPLRITLLTTIARADSHLRLSRGGQAENYSSASFPCLIN
ncbi:hypothetical protein RRG08_053165 [Elysia crispata]|uniref:Uncharacterized protein n=1 Tax=Elysia crispata TaxID=231223 RepID=A0AAE0YR00_9GAST|nr:hypothetical protein RRG08_053165 [Elysia crispata]